MVKGTVTICNRSGLHARPASDFVNAAAKFKSKITISNVAKPDTICNAKSIVSLLMMGLVKGTEVEIAADGPDEQQALETLIQAIDGGLGEGA